MLDSADQECIIIFFKRQWAIVKEKACELWDYYFPEHESEELFLIVEEDTDSSNDAETLACFKY